MATKKLLDMLNQALAREIQVSIQYMWQHVKARGLASPEISDRLRNIAIVEMGHAERIAERIDYLGGEPTTKPAPITVGDELEEMLEVDVKAEEEAIELYKQIIEQAAEEKDYVTRRMFEEILADEEEHHNIFTTILGRKEVPSRAGRRRKR